MVCHKRGATEISGQFDHSVPIRNACRLPHCNRFVGNVTILFVGRSNSRKMSLKSKNQNGSLHPSFTLPWYCCQRRQNRSRNITWNITKAVTMLRNNKSNGLNCYQIRRETWPAPGYWKITTGSNSTETLMAVTCESQLFFKFFWSTETMLSTLIQMAKNIYSRRFQFWKKWNDDDNDDDDSSSPRKSTICEFQTKECVSVITVIWSHVGKSWTILHLVILERKEGEQSKKK